MYRIGNACAQEFSLCLAFSPFFLSLTLAVVLVRECVQLSVKIRSTKKKKRTFSVALPSILFSFLSPLFPEFIKNQLPFPSPISQLLFFYFARGAGASGGGGGSGRKKKK